MFARTICLLILAFRLMGRAFAAPVEQQTDVFEIRERMFRLFIQPSILAPGEVKNPCYQQWMKKWKVCYLAISPRQDPEPAMMKRLVELGRPVRPVSAAPTNPHPRDFMLYSVEDAKTGTIGFIVYLDEIHWINKNKATMIASYYSGGLNGTSATFTLEKLRGKWKVTAFSNIMKS